MSKKVTTEEFIKKAKNVHGDRYNYDESVYTKFQENIIIICKEHGKFEQTPNNHLKGRNCKKCGDISRKNKILQEYGVDNISKSALIKEKKMLASMQNYGVSNISQNASIKEKKIQTSIENYGVDYHFQKNIKFSIKKLSDRTWLDAEINIKNKNVECVSAELGLTCRTVYKAILKHDIIIKNTTGYSLKCIQWLESIMEKEGIFIQHAGNIGEYKIPNTRYRVDGYCEETNTVYEFHGDCFHGNPDLFEDNDKPNFYQPETTAKELYEKTINRENKIKNLGHSIVTIWENEFNKLITLGK